MFRPGSSRVYKGGPSSTNAKQKRRVGMMNTMNIAGTEGSDVS